MRDDILIGMCIYDTTENRRTEYTIRMLSSLANTVDLYKHRLVIVDNDSCEDTKDFLTSFSKLFPVTIITLKENIGIARAVNIAWGHRLPDQCAMKIDNDIIVNQNGWVEDMVIALKRNPEIGAVALKNKLEWQHPNHTDSVFKTRLEFLNPIGKGNKWMVFEYTPRHLNGICRLYTPEHFNRVGYLIQPHIYGYEDALMCLRTSLSGLKMGYLPHIDADHIDRADNEYTEAKRIMAGLEASGYRDLHDEFVSKKIPIYVPYDEADLDYISQLIMS